MSVSQHAYLMFGIKLVPTTVAKTVTRYDQYTGKPYLVTVNEVERRLPLGGSKFLVWPDYNKFEDAPEGSDPHRFTDWYVMGYHSEYVGLIIASNIDGDPVIPVFSLDELRARLVAEMSLHLPSRVIDIIIDHANMRLVSYLS